MSPMLYVCGGGRRVNSAGLRGLPKCRDLCFFRCLAIFKGANIRRFETKTRELFTQYAMNFDLHNFNGIAMRI